MDNETNILLSICIPTFNRCDILEKTILSIIEQSAFDERIEIVISDNCSTDATREVALKYQAKYSNILYNVNSENIIDRNFVKALELGSGEYLKLVNDYAVMKPNGLYKMLAVIEENINLKQPIYFSNGTIKDKRDYFICENFDSFVQKASFFSTWILCFGIWKRDLYQLDDLDRYFHLSFIQTDILYRSIGKSDNKIIVVNELIFTLYSSEKVNYKKFLSYNYFDLFVNNFLFIVDNYLKQNKISRFTLNRVKKDLFFQHVVPTFIFLYISKTQFADVKIKEAIHIVYKTYKNHFFFYVGCLYVVIYYLFFITHLIFFVKVLKKLIFKPFLQLL